MAVHSDGGSDDDDGDDDSDDDGDSDGDGGWTDVPELIGLGTPKQLFRSPHGHGHGHDGPFCGGQRMKALIINDGRTDVRSFVRSFVCVSVSPSTGGALRRHFPITKAAL